MRSSLEFENSIVRDRHYFNTIARLPTACYFDSTPRTADGTSARLLPAAEVRVRKRSGGTLRPLLPEPVPGLDISRMQLVPSGQIKGVPHTPGTREYLTCETGRVHLTASGERWELGPGDALVFRGDQRHTYINPDSRQPAVAISVVCFAPVAA